LEEVREHVADRDVGRPLKLAMAAADIRRASLSRCWDRLPRGLSGGRFRLDEHFEELEVVGKVGGSVLVGGNEEREDRTVADLVFDKGLGTVSSEQTVPSRA